jgi:hypothetical protein
MIVVGIVRQKRSWGADMSGTIESVTSTADRKVEHVAQRTATDNRAQIAREIATAKDPEILKDLVDRYILDSTRNVAIPGDRLRSIEKAVIALRPRDAGFRRLVREQGELRTQLWQAQGLSHQVWDKLGALGGKRDWAGVKAEVANQIATLAATSATMQAVQDYKDKTLLAYGPKEPDFRKGVENAVSEFLATGPANAASEIARLCDIQGPDAAAKKLRELTDPERTTPLEAALILNRAKPTIDIISRAFGPLLFQQRPNGPFRSLNIPVQQQMFSDLGAAVDSASRSQEAALTIEQIGRALSRGPVYANVEKSVADGHLVLPLEMLKQLGGPRDDGGSADRLSGAVRNGLAGLRAKVEQSVLQFAKSVQPLESPAANWDALLPRAEQDGQPFKTPDQTAQQWVAAHPDLIPQAQSDLKRLNRDGYQMTRAIAALNEYLPQLPQSKNVNEMRKLAEIPENSAVAFAQAVSPASVVEAARLFNTKGLHGIALEDPNKIVPDPSWPSRAVRNNLQQTVGLRTGAVPFGLGLSLYGTGTYIWGVKNQTTEWNRNYGDPGWMTRRGWRVAGFMAMYATGTAIEGTHVVSQIVSKRLGLEASDSGWRGFVAKTAANVKGSPWQKFFSNHIKAFGIFNAAGTVNYFIQGDYERGAALGVATAGNLLASFGPELGLRAWAPVVGTGGVVVGSLALLYFNVRDQHRRATLTEPFNKDYLITAGLRPAIAEKLAKNDSDGLSAGPKLLQLAKHVRVTPQELLQYLHAQDPGWVGDFVQDALHAVQPNEQGQYPASRPGQNLRMRGWPPMTHYGPSPGMNPSDWRNPRMVMPTTLEGIVEWAALTERRLPRR